MAASEPRDISLEILDFGQHAASRPWALPERRTTTLIVLLPGEEAPVQEDVVAALQRGLGELIEASPAPTADDLWGLWVELEGFEAPLLVSALAAHAESHPGTVQRQQPSRWAVRIETLLNDLAPIDSYAALLSAAVELGGGPTAILDIEADRWLTRPLLERIASGTAASSADLLWSVHAIVAEDGPAAGTAWVHTHGLWRCNAPELELLGVPGPLVNAAIGLLNHLAEQMLDSSPPPAGERWEIGRDEAVVLYPWTAAILSQPEGSPGRQPDREEMDEGDPGTPHQGVRAVISEPGEPGRVPERLLERLASASVALYRSRQSTQRETTLARSTWPHFVEAWQEWSQISPRPEAQWRVKVGFQAMAGGESSGDREHVWVRVESVAGETVQGVVEGADSAPPRSVAVAIEQVSGWSAMIDGTIFGPRQAHRLLDAVQPPAS